MQLQIKIKITSSTIFNKKGFFLFLGSIPLEFPQIKTWGFLSKHKHRERERSCLMWILILRESDWWQRGQRLKRKKPWRAMKSEVYFHTENRAWWFFQKLWVTKKKLTEMMMFAQNIPTAHSHPFLLISEGTYVILFFLFGQNFISFSNKQEKNYCIYTLIFD